MRYLLLMQFFLLPIVHSQAADLSTFFAESEQFFQKWVRHGQVDYTGVKKNFTQISGLYEQINQMSLQQASASEQKAFYINSYNLAVIYQVAKYYPLKSPMNQSGFFDKVKHEIAGEAMTLNALEIEKIVLSYRDPRIHFALACAAKSCPHLANFAYVPNQLEQQLESRTKKAINDPEFIVVKEGGVAVSKLFDWYKKDFTQNGQTVIQFINQYRARAIPTSSPITYYPYNWQLNDR